MANIITDFKWPATISTILVLPLMILEWVNRREFHEIFPVPLFGILWLLPAAFALTLIPIVENIRAGNKITGNPVGLLLKVVLLIIIAWLWVGITLDQMPCFLGVPNCD